MIIFLCFVESSGRDLKFVVILIINLINLISFNKINFITTYSIYSTLKNVLECFTSLI